MIKRLQDGGTAFYPSKGAAVWIILVGVLWLFICWLFVSASNSNNVNALFRMVVVVVFGLGGVVMAGFGLKKMFWPAPMCVIYPEKIRAGQLDLFWDDFRACFLREEWRGAGRSRRLVDVLVFVRKANAGVEETVEFFLLGKADRAALQREIELRGILFGPPQTLDLPFGLNFLKKIGIKKN